MWIRRIRISLISPAKIPYWVDKYVTKLSLVADSAAGSSAPAHTTRAWFDQICDEYELESQHLKILQSPPSRGTRTSTPGMQSPNMG